jgi:2-oxoglutarate dehydrogenase E2 component (dihydrolipoamide succinyltransferase)
MSGVDIRAPSEQTEGTRLQVLRWLKQVGESVSENEPLIEIETDKVTVEVASPGAGVLREILRHENEEVAPGELLGRLESEAPAHPAAGDATRAPGTASPSAAPAPAAPAAATTAPRPAGALSPAVRRLLAEHGLEAAALAGSGEGGRISVDDVLKAAEQRRAVTGEPAAPAPPDSRAAVAAAGASGAGVRRVPHTPIRRRIAEHLTQSLLHTAPHVTTVFEADLSAVLQDRTRRREEFAQRGVPLTLTAYFVQAAVAGIRAVPEANSRWTDSALEIYEFMHIGIATAVEGSGLLVPVLRDAQSLTLFDTARALDDLIVRARGGALTPAEVRGGTFTISNHGVSGSLLAAPIIINQPQSAILGVGKLQKRPVVLEEGDEEKLVVRPCCYVTLTLDHRAMDGHQANRFMQSFVERLEQWSP